MIGRLIVATELGIGENILDTKNNFHPSPHRKLGFTTKKLNIGGAMGKVSTKKGNTGPGLLPSQRLRSGSNSVTQVIKDSLGESPGILYTYKQIYLIGILRNLFFLFNSAHGFEIIQEKDITKGIRLILHL